MKILLAVDGSAYTKKMLAYLTTHDEVFGSKNDHTLFSVQLPLPPCAQQWPRRWPTATTPKRPRK
jgi:hypothetical protein